MDKVILFYIVGDVESVVLDRKLGFGFFFGFVYLKIKLGFRDLRKRSKE